MSFKRILPELSFRTKVLVPVVACMAGLMVMTYFIVNYRITQQGRTEGKRTLETAADVFRNLQKVRKQNFLLRFKDLPSEPQWRAQFQQGDPATLSGPLKKFMTEQGVHVALYTSSSK